MKYTDYYEILGIARGATQDEVKRAYRKLARKYHPDVSKDPDADARFKELGEAYAVLKDPEKRAAYDQMGSNWKAGQDFQPPPGWDSGFEFSGKDAASEHNDFFEALFGRQARAGQRQPRNAQGQDHHAKILIDLVDAFRGAQRSVSLRMPVLDAQGMLAMQERKLDVSIPKGVRAGQHLRLVGQGAAGLDGGKPGDLYLEIAFAPHPLFRADGRDVYLNLPLAPWEAALGAVLAVPTPEGPVELTIPANSVAGRQMRLKGRGIPGTQAGDLYVLLSIALPQADTEDKRQAYRAMAQTFDNFKPRANLEV